MNWTRRSFLASAAAAPLLAGVSNGEKGLPSARPNFVLIVVEDLAAWMVGCYGNLEIKTPNLDKLAGSGLRFRNAVSVCPVCTPYCAALLTGR